MQIFAITISVQMANFDALWFDALTEMRGSYSCTYPSIEIDLDQFVADKVNPINFSLNIILINGLLFLFTLTNFFCHYRLMMQWWLQNPKDGRQIARKIQVGIPVDAH